MVYVYTYEVFAEVGLMTLLCFFLAIRQCSDTQNHLLLSQDLKPKTRVSIYRQSSVKNTSLKLQAKLPYVYISGDVGNSAQGMVMKRPPLPTYFTKIESEKFIIQPWWLGGRVVD